MRVLVELPQKQKHIWAEYETELDDSAEEGSGLGQGRGLRQDRPLPASELLSRGSLRHSPESPKGCTPSRGGTVTTQEYGALN